MKRMRQMVVGLMVAFAFVLPGNGCGPFSTVAVFVRSTRPDAPYAEYVAGKLGVPRNGYRQRHLVVAYDWLNGYGLNAGEQAEAIAVDAALNAPFDLDSKAKPASGMAAWMAAEKAAGGVAAAVPTDRPVPNDVYQTFANCLDDAFQTAAQTLTARAKAHGADAANLANWVAGQDAVFKNCDGSVSVLPANVAANAPVWLRQDRAYQVAASKFYQADYDGAIVQLRTVANDGVSPWHDMARLVIARAMIRRATVGNVALGLVAKEPVGGDAAEKLQAAQKAQEPRLLAQARDELSGILADPKLAPLRPCAQRLLDYVMLRLDPAAQKQTLARRVSGKNRPQDPAIFRQGLIDLRYTAVNAAPVAPNGKSFGLTDWLGVMSLASLPGTGGGSQASEQALAGWRSTHETAWLIAALNTAKAGDAAVPELLRAAAALPATSPAALAVTYQRLRLTLNQAGTRAELEALPVSITRGNLPSTINLFHILKQRSSPTLAAFIESAGTLPVGVYVDDEDEDSAGFDPEPRTAQLCGPDGVASRVMLFNHEAATLLNTRLPLAMMAEAASGPLLPANLRFQLAQATWTRAVLLKRPAIAKSMTPILEGCYPAWKPWLEKYDAAVSPQDREADGLLAMMRFASTEPVVRDGEQRENGFATYSEYRDNWWQGSTPASPTTGSGGQGVAASFFATSPATPRELPDPPFLTAENHTEAASEISALTAIPCASDYFAQGALAWQKDHPTDARAADVLGFAERVVRNGCRTDATKELNHRLFTVVQAQYPKSEWAKKYTNWE